MKKQIWKFPLTIVDKQEIKMPIGSEILCVQTQNETPYLWALVNPESENENRMFEIFGTGGVVYYDMGVNRKYIGTGQMQGGGFVYHLFERF